MKKIFFIFLLSLCCLSMFAHHTKGGWMRYEYLGPGINDASKLRYKITLNVYMICSAVRGQQIDDPINFTFFDGNNQFIEDVPVSISNISVLQNCSQPGCNPCISNIPPICYQIVTYELIKELSPSVNGYTISWQRCCRSENLANVPSDGSNVGDTWTIKIPGTINVPTGPSNTSPLFLINDTAIICSHNFFTYKFDAVDVDGDSLSYSFAPAWNGAFPGEIAPLTASNPPYSSVPYTSPFSALQPLGSGVTINPVTGLVSGIAPDVGEYVLAVLVTEYRNSIAFASSRKSLHIQVADCSPVSVRLDPFYISCDGFTKTFSNNAVNPGGTIYSWNFGDINSGAQNTSTSSNPVHTYSDTGIFKLTLTVSLNGQCTNTDSSIVRVYPGFFPGFISTGVCKNTQIQFTDTTKTAYGIVNAWSWNFGDPTTLADTSHVKNPTYSFGAAGNYDITFFVSSSKGCAGTVTQTITIKDKPDLTVTNDTLICSIDTLQLNAVGNGNFFWTPNYNINNQNNPSPLVSPDVPTKYYVTLTDPFGCIGMDSVFVDVKQFVTLDAGKDTGICGGDAVQLNPISDALHYLWSPSSVLNNDTAKYPIATPLTATTFYVIGNIGKCQATDSVRVRVTPYPGSGGIPDTLLCFGKSIQFHETGGSIYTWSPAFFLNNPNIPDPVANPDRSIRYIVTIRDTLGCPKPVFDTVVVQVQRVIADAGPRDTSIVINQPLQLNGTGGQFYLWTPPIGLNNPAIANPVALLSNNMQYVLTASTAAGCIGTDTINVTVYKVLPGLYVPNAFSPNNDGINDVFKPVAIGIKQINYFKVFNRWGQLMFSTTQQNVGWDGSYKGKQQDNAVFVWIAEAIDYQDKKITQKGTVTLIK